MIIPEKINPIIKLTERCNYNCEFCRYANHSKFDTGIDEKLVIKMVLESIAFNKEHGNNRINIIFHGGEPLPYGAERLASILEYIKKKNEFDTVIDYSIQTNSSLISDEWIDIFEQFNFDVGISLDGPPELNAHWRLNPKESVIEAVNKYHMLRDRGVRCGFLSVITNTHLVKMKEFFDFFVDNKIDSVGLCYCYSNTDGGNVDPEKLGEWLIRLYDLYYYSNYNIKIREFDTATRRIIKKIKNSHDITCRNNCGKYLTLMPSGRVDFCDDYEGIPLGNICEVSLCDIINGEQYRILKEKTLSIVSDKCMKCEVMYICKGGCARNDLKGSNYFCETYKVIYPYIEERVLSYLNSCNC